MTYGDKEKVESLLARIRTGTREEETESRQLPAPEPKNRLSAGEKEFRRKREIQLDQWQKEHPNSPRKAAQHLHSPESSKRFTG